MNKRTGDTAWVARKVQTLTQCQTLFPKCETATQQALECEDEECAVPVYAITPPTLEDSKGIVWLSFQQVGGSIWWTESTEKRGSVAKSSDTVTEKVHNPLLTPYRITTQLNASFLFNLLISNLVALLSGLSACVLPACLSVCPSSCLSVYLPILLLASPSVCFGCTACWFSQPLVNNTYALRFLCLSRLIVDAV